MRYGFKVMGIACPQYSIRGDQLVNRCFKNVFSFSYHYANEVSVQRSENILSKIPPRPVIQCLHMGAFSFNYLWVTTLATFRIKSNRMAFSVNLNRNKRGTNISASLFDEISVFKNCIWHLKLSESNLTPDMMIQSNTRKGILFPVPYDLSILIVFT